jgi:hypothetical protein
MPSQGFNSGFHTGPPSAKDHGEDLRPSPPERFGSLARPQHIVSIDLKGDFHDRHLLPLPPEKVSQEGISLAFKHVFS